MHLDLRTREVSPGRSDIQAAAGEGGGQCRSVVQSRGSNLTEEL